MKTLIMFFLCTACTLMACRNNERSEKAAKNHHHLNIPADGIETLMEANTSKILQGTQGSIILTLGEVTNKKVDISIKRNDRILDEKLLHKDETMTFDYEDNTYQVTVNSIKKPLIGTGKAEITITKQ